MAAWEAYSATWNLGTNSAFALGPRKTTKNLDRVGRLQDLPDANWLVASSPALNTWAITLVPICPFDLLKNIYKLFYKYFYAHVIWISTEPCITPAEGMNAYMNKCAYNYTHVYVSVILWLSVNLEVYYSLKKIRCFKRFAAHAITKTMFHSSVRLILPP
jgi:hypothetical protein